MFPFDYLLLESVRLGEDERVFELFGVPLLLVERVDVFVLLFGVVERVFVVVLFFSVYGTGFTYFGG